jgi:hypothetical protein
MEREKFLVANNFELISVKTFVHFVRLQNLRWLILRAGGVDVLLALGQAGDLVVTQKRLQLREALVQGAVGAVRERARHAPARRRTRRAPP